jgi:hypothetical protein
MSHDLSERTARARTERAPTETWPRSDRSLNTDTVNAVESASLKDSGTCESPVCSVRFDQTGMAINPRRFCCDQCKMDAWTIRRVAKLLENATDERLIEIMRGKP